MFIKSSKKVVLAFVALAVINFSSCKEDKKLSKAELLTAKWNVTKWSEGTDTMIPSQEEGTEISIEMEFESDGDFVIDMSATYTYDSGETYSYTYTYSGKWRFSDDEKSIFLSEPTEPSIKSSNTKFNGFFRNSLKLETTVTDETEFEILKLDETNFNIITKDDLAPVLIESVKM